MTRASFRLFRTCLIGSVVLALAAGGRLAGGGQLAASGGPSAGFVVAMIPTALLARSGLPSCCPGLLTARAGLGFTLVIGPLESPRPVRYPETAGAFPFG